MKHLLSLTVVLTMLPTLAAQATEELVVLNGDQELLVLEASGSVLVYEYSYQKCMVITENAKYIFDDKCVHVWVEPGFGADHIDVVLLCPNVRATVEGSYGDDYIDGRNCRCLRVDARSGDDEIHGSGHSKGDTLYGGSDNDLIYGYGGDDKIAGGAGSDEIYGGAGNDQINAGEVGEAGSFWGAGPITTNFVFGGDGDDHLVGTDGHDYLLGEAGDDILVGGRNKDYLSGGVGDDRLIPGWEDETAELYVSGGPGADFFYIAAGKHWYETAYGDPDVNASESDTVFQWGDDWWQWKYWNGIFGEYWEPTLPHGGIYS